jgi:hypothetical protein
MNANVQTIEARSLSDAELEGVNGGAVPSPAILFREQVAKTASDAYDFVAYMSTQWPY